MSWLEVNGHRMKRRNAMRYELHTVRDANLRIAYRMVRLMGGLMSMEDMDMDLDYVAELLRGALESEWVVDSLLIEQGVGPNERS